MADQVGAYYDNGQPAYWIEEATGKPYKYKMVNGVEDRSQKFFISPAALQPYASAAEQGKPEGNGFFGGRAQWNTEKGEWERPVNYGNIAALGVGAGIAAPFVAGGRGGGGAGAGVAGGGLASTSLAGTGMSTAVPGAGMTSGVTGGGGFLGALKTGKSIYDRASDIGRVASGQSAGR